MTETKTDHVVVTMINGDRIAVTGRAEDVAHRLNPTTSTAGGLNALDETSGELVLVNARHVVSVRGAGCT
jgi:hypothetical protein